MASTETQVATVLGVLAIVLGIMFYSRVAARRPLSSSGGPTGGLLLKFAHHEGHVVGETVATDGDQLILKQAGVFKSVPLALAHDEGREVRLVGDVDWDAALAKGRAWHERHTAGQDPKVTDRLTRSEDVRAPALESVRRGGAGPSAGAGAAAVAAGGAAAGMAARGEHGTRDAHGDAGEEGTAADTSRPFGRRVRFEEE